MVKAKSGDTVRVHYTGKLNDGSIFETSKGSTPLEFTLGEGQILPGFEETVSGMEPGEVKTTKIAAKDAYGEHHPDMVFIVDREKFPAEINPKMGDQFSLPQSDGSVVTVTVTGITETKVTLDANHPMAGKDLTFDIELIEIV